MSAPLEPIDVVHTTLSFNLAEIQWLIPVVVYTPENYTVIYGRDETLLNYNSSDVVMSTNNINQMYSATSSGLEPNTTYYYQVIARNSIGVNSSNTGMLVTPTPCKCDTLLCEYYNYAHAYMMYSSNGIREFQW